MEIEIGTILPDLEENLPAKALCYLFSAGMLYWFIRNSIKLNSQLTTTYIIYLVVGLIIGIPLCNYIVNVIANK